MFNTRLDVSVSRDMIDEFHVAQSAVSLNILDANSDGGIPTARDIFRCLAEEYVVRVGRHAADVLFVEDVCDVCVCRDFGWGVLWNDIRTGKRAVRRGTRVKGVTQELVVPSGSTPEDNRAGATLFDDHSECIAGIFHITVPVSWSGAAFKSCL